jgi:ribonuclease HI
MGRCDLRRAKAQRGVGRRTGDHKQPNGVAGRDRALKALEEPRQVKLHSEGAYLVNAFHEGWICNWERNGWRKADKKPVQNADLWRELLALTKRHDVEFAKIAGHAGVPANERCHVLVKCDGSKEAA